MGFRRGVPGRLARAALLLLGAASTAAAQSRPLRTETAETAAVGTLVLETGFDVIADEPSYVTGASRTRWDGPLLRAVYSPADSVELDVEWVAAVGVAGEEGRGDIQSWDWGDVALRAKWRFARGGGRRPALAARFGVVLPQTSFEDEQFRPLGLGPNTLRAFVEALVDAARRPGPASRGRGPPALRPGPEAPRPERLPLVRSRARVAARLAAHGGRGGGGPGRTGQPRRRPELGGARRSALRAAGACASTRRCGAGCSHTDGTWGVTAGLAWTARAPR